MVAGLAMFGVLADDVRRRRPPVNRFIGNTPEALLYASAVVFLGPGSMLMHGTHTPWGGWVDNVSMVAYIAVPLLVNLALLGGWSRRAFFVAYASLVVVYSGRLPVARTRSGHRPGAVQSLDTPLAGVRDRLPVVVARGPCTVGSRRVRHSGGFRDLPGRDDPESRPILVGIPLLAPRGGGPTTCRRTALLCAVVVGRHRLIPDRIRHLAHRHPGASAVRPRLAGAGPCDMALLSAVTTWCFFMFFRSERPVSRFRTAI